MSKADSLNIGDYLAGDYDLGLGLCLQCVAEFKLGGEQPEMTPRWAVVLAPIVGQGGTGGSCYQHLSVQAPQPIPPPMPQPMRHPMQLPTDPNTGELLMPNGQPIRARHAR